MVSEQRRRRKSLPRVEGKRNQRRLRQNKFKVDLRELKPRND